MGLGHKLIYEDINSRYYGDDSTNGDILYTGDDHSGDMCHDYVRKDTSVKTDCPFLYLDHTWNTTARAVICHILWTAKSGNYGRCFSICSVRICD